MRSKSTVIGDKDTAHPPSRRPFQIALTAVVIGLFLTGAFFWNAHRVAVTSFRKDFDSAAAIRSALIREKLEESLLMAQAVRRFHDASDGITRSRFSAFTAKASGGKYGLRALSWVPVVLAKDRQAFEALGKREIGEAFEIVERDARGTRIRAGRRYVYYPVSRVEPFDECTLPAHGFDCGSDPDRLVALERARDTGEPIATRRVRLAEKAPCDGVLVFEPLYRKGFPVSTVTERRAALEGFAMAVLRADILLTAALAKTEPLGLPFDLLDLSDSNGGRLLHRWKARLAGESSWLLPLLLSPPKSLDRFPFGGREWGVEVTAGDGYLRRNYPLAHWAFLPVGALLAAFLGGYLYTILGARERAEEARKALEAEVAVRKRAEEELHVSETRYRIVADHTGDWVFWLTPEDSFRYISPACKAVTGHLPQEFEADPGLLLRLIHPDDAALFSGHRHVVKTGERSGPLEFRIVRPDGSTRWLEHHCRPVFDDAGRFLGTRGSNRDVTDRKKLEAQLRQAQKLESLGVLAGGAAHELNNILMGILGNAELTLRKLPETSPVRAKIEAVVTSTQRAADLVQRLLTFAGAGARAEERISLAEAVEEALVSLRQLIPDVCELQVDLGKDVPLVLGDGGQLRQVALNLGLNAAESLGEEGGKVLLKVGQVQVDETSQPVICIDRNLPSGTYVFLEVVDNGCGIPPEDQAKIFDPFFTTKFAGRGLGLPVVRGVVRNHEGGIQVSSDVARGTTIRVFLPVA